MAGSSTSGMVRPSTTQGPPAADENPQDNDSLVNTALTLMERFGLTVDDILNQTERAKTVINKLQSQPGGADVLFGSVAGAAGTAGVASPLPVRRSPSPMDLDDEDSFIDKNASNFEKQAPGLLGDAPLRGSGSMEFPEILSGGGLGQIQGRKSLLGQQPGKEQSSPVVDLHANKKPLLEQSGMGCSVIYANS